jgi:T5SS/PEP-CTERM-associated repeat protein
MGFGRNTLVSFNTGADATVGQFLFTPIVSQSLSLTADGTGTTLTETLTAGTTWSAGGAVFVNFSNNAAGTFGGVGLATNVNGGSADLTVSTGADVTVATFFNVATTTVPATSNVLVQGAGSTLTVGSFLLGANVASTGALTITNGAVFTSTSAIANNIINPTGTLTLDGGTLNVTGALSRNGGAFNFIAGTLNLAARSSSIRAACSAETRRSPRAKASAQQAV